MFKSKADKQQQQQQPLLFDLDRDRHYSIVALTKEVEDLSTYLINQGFIYDHKTENHITLIFNSISGVNITIELYKHHYEMKAEYFSKPPLATKFVERMYYIQTMDTKQRLYDQCAFVIKNNCK